MNMSRAVRRQLIGADMVRFIVRSYRAAGEIFATPEASRILSRMERLVEEVAGYVYGKTNENGEWELDDKATKAYQDAVTAVEREMLSRYSDGADPRDYLAAALIWVEDLRGSLPSQPAERRWAWFQIAEQLQKLSEVLDPERAEDAPVESGIQNGEAFKSVAGVW